IVLADVKDLPVDPQETPYKGTCSKCKGTEFVPDTDVMDTWNTSSLTPYLCYQLYAQEQLGNMSVFDAQITKKKPFLPMSMRPQAHDIIRTWAFDTIVKLWMHTENVPWEEIVISGHVLSDSKEKLSKSKGNSKLTPESLLQTYPADVIRFWTASGSLGQNVAFSENQLKIGQRLVTKLWNAFRFVEEHVVTVAPDVDPGNLGASNEWLLHNASHCFAQYTTYFEQHEFGLALGCVEKFFWHDFCDNYLELIKDQLFKPEQYDQHTVLATRWTLYQVGLRILQMYAPYLPHLTETIYQQVYKKTNAAASVHQTRFAAVQLPREFAVSAGNMEALLQVIAQVRRLKTEQQLSLKTPLQTLLVTGDNQAVLETIKLYDQLLRGIAQAIEISYKAGDKPAGLEQRDGLWHAVVRV
ncbi:MAG TPA: class I tRNA ligase family protein, partial [Candidatus Limnocylindria bacterium]|nr:class I tRNA ligase family protein [Candidatus Limnocylindria bacterium]